ncbi:hypothetical protein V6N11_034480 [Hibiscus sabdariffa]|uniref:Uncharacterized protein n=2 Tax=Hibiscus sabdariffa TaxID=183260 RepID=A0ABR2B5R2_9ROSI
MPLRRETRANVGQADVGTNAGKEHVPPPPPPPQDIEVSLGERKKEDASKRAADSSAIRKLSKKARDKRFRLDRRLGGFGRGPREQSVARAGVGVPFCDKCDR